MIPLVAALLVAQAPAFALTLAIPGSVVVAGLSVRTSTTATYLLAGDLDGGRVHRCSVRVDSPAGSGASFDRDAPLRALARRSFPVDDDVDVTLLVGAVPVHVVTHVRGTVHLGERGRAVVEIDEQRVLASTIPLHLAPRVRIDARYTLQSATVCPGGPP